MRLAVSNIAWAGDEREKIYRILCERGVGGVEIAPTKIAPWDAVDDDLIDEERRLIASFGLAVSSYQALYFGKPELQLLGTEQGFEDFLHHTLRVARFAERLSGGGIGVLGAPRNRIAGPMDAAAACDVGADRLRRLAEAIAPHGFALGLEPAPPAYGGDFLVTTHECADMVRRVGHPSLRLHVDAGCMALNGEAPDRIVADYIDVIGHVHLSRPHLAAIDLPPCDRDTSLLRALRAANYDGWIALEMRQTDDPAGSIAKAIDAALAAAGAS